MTDKEYWQFDLNFSGDSICGYCHPNSTECFTIEQPIFTSANPLHNYKLASKDNTCYLPKQSVVCYYRINEPTQK